MARKSKPAAPAPIPEQEVSASARGRFLKRNQRTKGRGLPVLELEGIGPVYAEKLKDAGITDSEHLMRADGDVVADKAGIPAVEVRKWQDMAELLHVKGVDPQYAELLVRCDINSVFELAQQDAVALHAKLQAFMASLPNKVVPGKVNERKVTGWIEGARRLVAVVPDKGAQALAKVGGTEEFAAPEDALPPVADVVDALADPAKLAADATKDAERSFLSRFSRRNAETPKVELHEANPDGKPSLFRRRLRRSRKVEASASSASDPLAPTPDDAVVNAEAAVTAPAASDPEATKPDAPKASRRERSKPSPSDGVTAMGEDDEVECAHCQHHFIPPSGKRRVDCPKCHSKLELDLPTAPPAMAEAVPAQAPSGPGIAPDKAAHKALDQELKREAQAKEQAARDAAKERAAAEKEREAAEKAAEKAAAKERAAAEKAAAKERAAAEKAATKERAAAEKAAAKEQAKAEKARQVEARRLADQAPEAPIAAPLPEGGAAESASQEAVSGNQAALSPSEEKRLLREAEREAKAAFKARQAEERRLAKAAKATEPTTEAGTEGPLTPVAALPDSEAPAPSTEAPADDKQARKAAEKAAKLAQREERKRLNEERRLARLAAKGRGPAQGALGTLSEGADTNPAEGASEDADQAGAPAQAGLALGATSPKEQARLEREQARLEARREKERKRRALEVARRNELGDDATLWQRAVSHPLPRTAKEEGAWAAAVAAGTGYEKADPWQGADEQPRFARMPKEPAKPVRLEDGTSPFAKLPEDEHPALKPRLDDGTSPFARLPDDDLPPAPKPRLPDGRSPFEVLPVDGRSSADAVHAFGHAPGREYTTKGGFHIREEVQEAAVAPEVELGSPRSQARAEREAERKRRDEARKLRAEQVEKAREEARAKEAERRELERAERAQRRAKRSGAAPASEEVAPDVGAEPGSAEVLSAEPVAPGQADAPLVTEAPAKRSRFSLRRRGGEAPTPSADTATGPGPDGAQASEPTSLATLDEAAPVEALDATPQEPAQGQGTPRRFRFGRSKVKTMAPAPEETGLADATGTGTSARAEPIDAAPNDAAHIDAAPNDAAPLDADPIATAFPTQPAEETPAEVATTPPEADKEARRRAKLEARIARLEAEEIARNARQEQLEQERLAKAERHEQERLAKLAATQPEPQPEAPAAPSEPEPPGEVLVEFTEAPEPGSKEAKRLARQAGREAKARAQAQRREEALAAKEASAREAEQAKRLAEEAHAHEAAARAEAAAQAEEALLSSRRREAEAREAQQREAEAAQRQAERELEAAAKTQAAEERAAAKRALAEAKEARRQAEREAKAQAKLAQEQARAAALEAKRLEREAARAPAPAQPEVAEHAGAEAVVAEATAPATAPITFEGTVESQVDGLAAVSPPASAAHEPAWEPDGGPADTVQRRGRKPGRIRATQPAPEAAEAAASVAAEGGLEAPPASLESKVDAILGRTPRPSAAVADADAREGRDERDARVLAYREAAGRQGDRVPGPPPALGGSSLDEVRERMARRQAELEAARTAPRPPVLRPVERVTERRTVRTTTYDPAKIDAILAQRGQVVRPGKKE